MVKKLISRSKFAELAGVSPAAVTKACGAKLKPACEGVRIDATHDAALDYLQARARARTESAATGLDPLYEEAVAVCQRAGKFSGRHIESECKVGRTRAKRILGQIKSAGLVPEKGTTTEPRPEVVVPTPAKPHARGHAAKNETKKREGATDLDDEAELLGVPENIQAFVGWTVGDVIEKFGTEARFVDFLKATKEIEMINERRIKNAKSRGELVSRELVKTGVIDHFEAAHIKLLSDGAKKISIRASAMIKAGDTPEELEKFVKDQLTSFIRPVKTKVTRFMKYVE